MLEDFSVTAGTGAFEIRFSCVMNAPIDQVYAIWADPNNVPEWWGPEFLDTVVERMDLIPGGFWRFIQRDKEGNTYAFHGVYHEVTPLNRVSYTFEYEGAPGSAMIEKIEFEDLNGKTKITGLSVLASFPDPEGQVLTDMKDGATVSMKRLADLIQKLSSEK